MHDQRAAIVRESIRTTLPSLGPVARRIFSYLRGGQQFRLAQNSDNMIFGAFTFDENEKPGAKYRRIARCVVEFICCSVSGLWRSTYF
jgi:hypothetical protein